MRILVGIGAIALGAAIAFVGGLIWSVCLGLNLALNPALPWSAAVMAVVLTLGWAYLSGLGWPRATREARAARLPQRALTARQWCWAMAAALGVMGASLCALLLAFRLLPIPISPLPATAQSAPLLALVYFGMGSLVAGLVEEAAFRGYMQAGVERAWGRPAAFLIVALAFAALHAANPEFLYLLPLYFVTSLALSTLVAMTGSVWPGVIAHALTDLASFLLLLLLGADAMKAPLFLSAPGGAFFVVASLGVAGLVSAVVGFSSLNKPRRAIEPSPID